MNTREFRFDRGTKLAPLVWIISQDGESYSTTHGQLNGAMQVHSDTPGDKGKPDTKGYVSALDNCTFHCSREVRYKEENGYIEWVDGKPVKEQINTLDPLQMLPKNFCSYKPQTSIEPAALEKLHKAGKDRYTRKYDGMCHIAVLHTGGWELYTRRMDLTTERVPLHIKQFESLGFEPGTIIVGELLCSRPDGRDDFKAISRFCRSLPEETRKIVDGKEIPEPIFVIFDILFHNGHDLKSVPYDARSLLWKSIDTGLIRSVDYFDLTPQTWEQKAKEAGWEGFVVTDGSSVPGDKFYSFDGSAKRPKGHWKLKPVNDEDTVIFACAPGSGKRLGGIGAVHVKQIHPETKQWIYCGKVGSGFTDEDLIKLGAQCKENKIPILEKDKEVDKFDIQNNDGLVCQIEFSERQQGTQKFRFPVFIRTRTDKAAEECVIQKLAPEEE